MCNRDDQLVRYAINAADIKQQDDAWEAFNRITTERDRLREALQRCAAYLDTAATCNSDRAMASMARAALKEGE